MAKDSDEPIAVALAKNQREISISQFFEKNRHLLGFDNKRKSLLTAIKEAVDNSLDACEEAKILPEISVQIIDMENDRFKVIVEDNGPGIVKNQIPKIFAKLLYGSKFHRLRQSRGQQGIGISAAVLYAQLTTGKPAKITSRIGKNHPAHYYELHIDTHNNKPEIVKDDEVEWNKEQGTKVELDVEASYMQGAQSVDEYIKETAIVNPHLTLIYTNPKAEQVVLPRTSEKPFELPKEIQPHPYGVEIGMLMTMLKYTQSTTLQSFLTAEFSRVGSGTAKQICENAALLPKTKPIDMSREMTQQLMDGIKKTKLMSPPTDCLTPIGEEQLEKGLRKEINAEFYATVTRTPDVYRGNPFVIEAGIAYGGNQPAEESIRLMRFANRVPLLYQQSACAVTKAVMNTTWRSYGISQSKNALPLGPCTVVIHVASVWVPFTSESKEAIAHYPEILKEMKLALQEVGRKLGSYIHKKKRVGIELKKRGYIEKYIPIVGEALREILKIKEVEEKKIREELEKLLEKTRGQVEDLEFDESKNVEYDEELAKIGKPDQKTLEDDYD
ncbi:DNA topoisomerase VI subunit B [Candidatus Woesearchaeota archaeon]|nr:DNA topoisomerase VI subunit B [Candidatus Woesearchaeota archaeon]